ncbi:unnamed protein product [Alopecurus aequalis]
MAGRDGRKGKEPAEDKFPEGMRVLAVDDDPDCRGVLEVLLRSYKYNPTMVTDARTALEMLRDTGKEQYDLVIADIHMPESDMDGVKPLELIGLEMDLPVFKLKNIWQHVIRKIPGVVNHDSSDSDDADQRVQPLIVEGEQGGAKRKKCSKEKKRDGEDSDENRESTSVSTTRKKPRVSWTRELHGRFMEAINLLGVDKAVPKTKLQMMDVSNLTRGNVASHLQKYRIVLKRLTDDPRKSNTLGDSFVRRKSPYYMRHGVSSLPDTRRRCISVPPVKSFTNVSSDHIMMDAFPPSHSSKSYASLLREKLLEVSIVEASSHPGNSSFTEMPNGELYEPVNQPQVQPPELVSQFSGLMNAASSRAGAHGDAQFPRLVGSSSNPRQNVAPSSVHIHMDGTPLAKSHVNLLQNQMVGINKNTTTSVGALIEQMTPLYNMESDTAPVDMRSDNYAAMIQMVNDGGTSSPLRKLHTGSSVAPPTQMVNSGSVSPAMPDLQDSSAALMQMLNPSDASGFLPVEEGPTDQQALDDQQPNYSTTNFLEDIYTSILNEDFNDDAFFDGEC